MKDIIESKTIVPKSCIPLYMYKCINISFQKTYIYNIKHKKMT